MADIYNNPVNPPSPSIDDYYNQSMQRVQAIRAGLRTEFAPEPEPTVRTARVALDAANNKLFIGGYVVDRNNDTDVATFSQYANQEAPLPEGNWEIVDDAGFAQYVQSIRDPGTLKLMARNFGMGVDEMQQMAGLGLQWLGAESAGQYLADQEADLQPNQVYSRNFTDIGSSPENGVMDWMAATIGRLGPNIVESTISAAAGAAIGGAVSGPAAPAGAPIGAIAGFFGKTAVKKALLEAAKKRLKGEALDAAEKKLLVSAAAMTSAASASKTRLMSPAAVSQFIDEATLTGAQTVGGQVARRAAQVGGAAGLSTASNVFQQTGAAYGETMADGSEGDRGVALGVGVLGGLADTIPEFILAGRLFSELGGDVIGAAKKQKSAMDLLKGAASGRTGRITKGAVGGAAIEGGTEGFQEILQIAANPILDLNSTEGANRVVNALAAGALMGGGMGGVGGAFAGSLANNKQEANLLLPVSQSDPNFIQYREDLKAQFGKDAQKKLDELYPPMAPRVQGPPRASFEQAAQADLQAQRQAAMDAQRQAAQQFVSGMPGAAQPVPAERLLGLAPQGAPVTTDQQLRQDAAAFFGGQAPRAPVTVPSTPTPVVAQQQALQQQALQQIQQAAQQTFGGQQQAAPVSVPPMAPPGTAAPLPIAPVVQQRGEAQAQAQEQARRAATDRIVTQRQQELARGRAQRFVAGPQRQPIAQAPMGAGMTTTVTVPPTAPLPQTTGAGPTLSMSGETTAAMQQRLKRGKKGGKTTVNVPTGTAASVETLSTGTMPELTPNITKAPESIRTFLNKLLLKGQNIFNETDIAKHIFSKMGKVTKLLKLEKLSRKQKDQVQRFADTMVNKLRVAERSGIGKDGEEFNITRETVDAFNAGTGGAGLRTLAEIPADRAAGEQPTAEPGTGGKAGTRNRGRNLKPTTREEPAPEAQGPAAGSEQAQAEADVPPAVKPLRKRKPTTAKAEGLQKGKKPESPKGDGGAATPSTTAKKTETELEAEIRRQNAERAARVQAAEAAAAAKRAEEEAAKLAVEAAKADDIRTVDDARAEANNAEGEALSRAIADLILLSKDKNISQEARDRAQDYLDGELDSKSIEYLNAEAILAGKNTDLDAQIVSETITQFNAGKPLGQYVIAKAREAWNRLQSKKLDPDYEGAKLSSYINPKDSQFFNVQFTPEGRRIVSKTLDAERKQGRNMLSMYDSVENAVDENGRPLKPIDKIKFKAIVDTFKRGLAKAPQISIYKNQADLRAKNPNLYQRAVAARPQGDFDTAQAAGYAFGEDQVIIFSDRIATPKMLRMVLAHEAIGHFGMRALLPVKQFDALMQYVYDNSPLARSIVDSEVEYSGMDRREAIEEYLANYASKLDTSIVTRIWNTIKNALNKLGIQFDDDLTRYLVNHARRYTREGASFFEPSKFALKVLDVESNMNGSGRFNIPSILPMQRELSFKLDMAGGMPSNLTDAWSNLKDAGVNTAQKFDQFVRTFFRLANYDALRNHGAAAYETLINGVRTVVAALRNQYNEDLADIMGLGEESRNAFSYSMYIGRSIAHQRFKLDPTMRSASLVKLIKNPDTDEMEIVTDTENFEKFLKLGTVSKDELNNGVTVKTPLPTSIFGTYKADEIKIAGVRSKLGRDLTDEEYGYYLKGRRKMAEIEIDLLKARYENYLKTEKISLSGVRKILNDGNLSEADMALAKNALNHAKSLISKKIAYDAQGLPTITSDGLSEANAFLAKFNEALIKGEDKYTDALKNEVRAFYENAKQADAAINAIEKFRERRRTISPELTRDIVFAVQDRLKEVVLADQMFEKAQTQARRTIAQGYIPVFREGGWQIRVEAQINGEPVTIHPEHQNKLILRLEDDRASSERGAKALNADLKDVEAEVLVLQRDGTYKTQKVTLFARASKTIDDVAADPSLDIDNFLHGMRMFGLATNPQAIEKVITTLTNPGSALRKSLRFDDTPGYDMTAGITAMSRHIVTRASLIAKTQFEPAMRELLDRTSDRGKLWFGDKEAVMTAKAKFDAATDERERAFYRDELITNLYKYRMTNPGAENWDGSRSTFPSQPEEAELGNVFYNNAIRTQQWLDGSENIAESTFEGKRMPAFLKAVTSVAFLGGSMAQFAQNLISPVTNVIPYLASKNGKTGFGGGFGVMAATIEYNRAFKDVVGVSGLKPFSRVKDESGKYSFRIGDPTNDAKYYFDIAKEFETARATKNTAREAELQAKYGLSYYEARNIGREIREGKLIPAQANAILETSRGLYADSKLGRAWLKFTDVYMVPFNVSEQAARRATFLAAFRLEFNRLKQAGMDEEAASERARAFGVDTVDLTLGEYSNTNRPPAWREGVQSLLFMYKTYPITATLLFRNLSYGGKIGMLTGLMLLSGLSGLPFAEDIEDLIDTLAQKFGMDIGQGPALRKFLTEQLDEVFPGIAPYVIRGVANQFLPADIASRTGIGNILPGTGAFLAGSDPSHELAEVAGPIFGMGYNMVKATYDLIRAPVSDTVTLTDALRNAPVSLMRSVGDVATYLQSGAIVDKRGYVVSPEVSAATVLTRLLGFYPVEAANQYEFIKYSRRATDYQKQISIAYRDAWIKAMMAGDTQQAAKIAQAVNDWNEANPNARLNNWMKNAQRSLKEARRPASERFLRSAPKASRENLQRYLDATME